MLHAGDDDEEDGLRPHMWSQQSITSHLGARGMVKAILTRAAGRSICQDSGQRLRQLLLL